MRGVKFGCATMLNMAQTMVNSMLRRAPARRGWTALALTAGYLACVLVPVGARSEPPGEGQRNVRVTQACSYGCASEGMTTTGSTRAGALLGGPAGVDHSVRTAGRVTAASSWVLGAPATVIDPAFFAVADALGPIILDARTPAQRGGARADRFGPRER